MSQHLDESPQSDTKMDISEATTSQESPSISPDTDDHLHKKLNSLLSETELFQTITPTNTKSKSKLATDTATVSRTKTNISTSTTATTTTMTSKTAAELAAVMHSTHLDNRKNSLNSGDDENVSNKNCSMLGVHQSVRSALTLVNSHPLMSPHTVDSDSENSPKRAFHFPDLIPINEPARFANANPTKSSLEIIQTSEVSSGNADCRTRIELSRVLDSSPENSDNDEECSDGESEPEVSQYQANVTPEFQSVALVSNTTNKIDAVQRPFLVIKRKFPVSSEFLSDDASSVETISNHSFDDDDDNEPNLISASISSSLLDDTGFNQQDNVAATSVATPTISNLPIDPIPQYSAADEARDSRSWQKITLPDGKTREIDMKVIEPYKRVLSHGGYLSSGGHNAIVVFSACHLPDRSRTDYHYVMDNLFLYVVKTLEQLVTEDYVLVYLHGGSSRGNVPPFPWLKKCYQLLDRRLRKSLKNLFMVHPTFWLKSLVWMARPFISSKFWRKLIYVRTLDELYHLVPVEKAAVPEKVKKYDVKYT